MNLLRILTIDKCLKDTSRKWSLQDLIDACEHTERNSKRSVQADIELMRSKTKGYSAPIIVEDKKYYTYSNKKYNLLKHHLSDSDKNSIYAAMEVINNYCYFDEMKHVSDMLINMHGEILKKVNIPHLQVNDEFTPKETEKIRLWIDYILAEHYIENKIHHTQVVEQEEIDGSINIYLHMPVTSKLEKLLIDNHNKIIVNSPLSLKKHIAQLIDNDKSKGYM